MLSSFLFFSPFVFAQDLRSTLEKALQKQWPHAQVSLGQITGNPKCQKPDILGESAPGKLRVHCGGEFEVSFEAKVKAWVAQKRVYPHEGLQSASFSRQWVDLTPASSRHWQGSIVHEEFLDQFESTQSILEGTPLLTYQMKRVPDVRRGDRVELQIDSGNLHVLTTGVAQENAYLRSSIKVITQKTKREFLGQLIEKGKVQITL